MMESPFENKSSALREDSKTNHEFSTSKELIDWKPLISLLRFTLTIEGR